MLRITIHDSPDEFRLRLEGRLSGPWVHEVECCWRTALSTVGDKDVTMDLREVDFVDDAGKALLAAMHKRGAKFVADGPMLTHVLAEITGIPVQQQAATAPRRKAHLRLRLLFLFLIMTTLAMAAEPLRPEQVIERYLSAAQLAECNRQDAVLDVVISANLPKLHKRGTLRALQYISSVGQASYRPVRFDGDATIERSVIARYLSIEADTRPDRDVRSIAVTPANYRFRPAGISDYNGAPAYVFRLEPREKRLGLFRGELWLDAKTFLPLREWGQLVKSPSLFVKSIYFVRDYILVNGRTVPRRTIAEVSTRLAGPAEVTVWSRCVTVGEKTRPADRTLLGKTYVQHGSNIVGSDACAL